MTIYGDPYSTMIRFPTGIPMGPATIPPIVSITVEPQTVKVGGTVTVTWSAGNATSVQLLTFQSSQWQTVPLSGSRTFTLPGQGFYAFHLRATGPGGTNQAYAKVETFREIAPPKPAVSTLVPKEDLTAQAPEVVPESPFVPGILSPVWDFLEQESIGGIKNKYLAGAGLVGLLLLLGRKK